MSRGIARYVRDLRNQIARLEVPESIQQSFGEYRDDPVSFVREVLGTESASRRSDGSPTRDRPGTLHWNRAPSLSPEWSAPQGVFGYEGWSLGGWPRVMS